MIKVRVILIRAPRPGVTIQFFPMVNTQNEARNTEINGLISQLERENRMEVTSIRRLMLNTALTKVLIKRTAM